MNLHIRPAWASFVSRIQGEACKQRGHAAIRITVIVDAEGNPLLWSEPKMTKLEPMARTADALAQLLNLLTD